MPSQPGSHLSGCEQFVWVGDVSISAHSWISFHQQDEIDVLKLQELSDDDGMAIYSRWIFPIRLHNRHNDYPLAPESLLSDRDMYSSSQQAVFPESAPGRKLTPNLRYKFKYIIVFVVIKIH